MLLLIFVVWAACVFVWQWVKLGMPLNPVIVFVAIWSTIKAAYYFVVAQSVWVVLWYGLVLLSADIITPPYVVDVETVIAVPIGMAISRETGLSLASSLVFAYVGVFVLAAGVIALHFFVVRKHLRGG